MNEKVHVIFITGGVSSSLGKGLSASAIASLLQEQNIRVSMQKMDPYINIDAGTMSPYQHGEVFVTDDGGETDLDLGNYERFTNLKMSRLHNVTAGQIYKTVIEKERAGKYLGETVQVIPHITDAIHDAIFAIIKKDNPQVLIIEIGGTVGDIESIPFLEAARQFSKIHKFQKSLFIHVTLIPVIPMTGEIKTKPSQHSVKQLLSYGIQPDILLCRSPILLPSEAKKKLALLCNVEKDSVIEAIDIKNTIYELPLLLHDVGIEKIICKKLNIPYNKKPNLSKWKNLVQRQIEAEKEIKIAIIGKYSQQVDTYKSIYEAIYHAAFFHKVKVKIDILNSEINVEEKILKSFDGFVIAGGFGKRGLEGKIHVCSYARKQNVPCLGICLGMQVMLIEFARSYLGMKEASSREFDPNTDYAIIELLSSQKNLKHLGSTMHLGSKDIFLEKNSKIYEIYQSEKIQERHRHRYEVNPLFQDALFKKDLKCTGYLKENNLIECIELENHIWFMGVQFHPEFKSNPHQAHPIFNSFVKTIKNKS